MIKVLSYPTVLFLLLYQVALHAADLGNLTPDQLESLQKQDALVIDIRTEKEWQDTGIIPDSHKLQFFDADGKFDSKQWLAQLEQLKKTPAQPVVLVCQSGGRSTMLGNFLTGKLGMQNVYQLQNGINAWIEQGKRVQK